MNFSNLKSVPGYQPFTGDYIPTQGSNVIQGAGGFSKSFEITHPTEKISQGNHIIVVDSRQRDCKLYPSPSYYRIPIDIYKNVSSIELKGSILPKTSYSINESNNNIDFSIGDSVSFINVINEGSGYIVAPTVTLSGPVSGIQATATAIIDPLRGTVSSIIINIAGSGYRSADPPIVYISPPSGKSGAQAQAVTLVGTTYETKIRPGNYSPGGNPVAGVTVTPTDLLLEIQNAMNYVVNGGPYDSVSVSPFAVRFVSQFPEINAIPGTPEAAPTNACPYNRIQITNVLGDPWELLWCSGRNHEISARRVLGFPWTDQTEPTVTTAINPGAGDIIPAGTSIRAQFDYDLTDDPNYVIMSFWAASEDAFERIECSRPGGLNRAFATLVFDANSPDNLRGITGTANTSISGVDYLEGKILKDTFWYPPGNVKPLKGYDFDQKYLEFNPPVAKLSSLNIKFTQYGSQSGGTPNEYNFMGRDHLLVFQITQNDQKSGERW